MDYLYVLSVYFFVCFIVSFFTIITYKYYDKIQEEKIDIKIKKLVRKYMRLYKKEIKNSKIVNMRDYVIDCVLADIQFKEVEYVKKIKNLYETEKQYRSNCQ